MSPARRSGYYEARYRERRGADYSCGRCVRCRTTCHDAGTDRLTTCSLRFGANGFGRPFKWFSRNCRGQQLLCKFEIPMLYISLVNMARMSSRRAQSGDVIRLFAIRLVASAGSACRSGRSSSGLTNAQRRRCYSMPSIAVLFSFEDVPSLNTIDTSEFGRMIVPVQTTVHAASLRQDPILKSASLIERNW